MTSTNKKLTMGSLQDYIREANSYSHFEYSLITDDSGLPILSSFEQEQSSENEAVLIAMVQRSLSNLGQELEMEKPTEIILNAANGKKLIIKPFQVGQTELTLAVLLPENKMPYKRATRSMINTIKSSWMV